MSFRFCCFEWRQRRPSTIAAASRCARKRELLRRILRHHAKARHAPDDQAQRPGHQPGPHRAVARTWRHPVLHSSRLAEQARRRRNGRRAGCARLRHGTAFGRAPPRAPTRSKSRSRRSAGWADGRFSRASCTTTSTPRAPRQPPLRSSTAGCAPAAPLAAPPASSRELARLVGGELGLVVSRAPQHEHVLVLPP